MVKLMLAAGAAALAIASPVAAERGQGGGNQKGGQEKARGGGNERGGPSMKADRGNRGGGDRVAVARGNSGRDRVEIRGNGRGNAERRVELRGNGDAKVRVRGNDRDVDVRIVDRDSDADIFLRTRGLANGCPPGLDKKDNGCMPPGQVKTLLNAPLRASFAESLLPYPYRSWFRDDDDFYYRAGDGFIYRVNRDDNLVNGLIPLFGSGYYTVGAAWPDPYNFYNVPYQYRSFYPEDADYYYRYGDGAIYQVNRSNLLVESIVALLGGDLGVGQRLPVGYDVYNVPFAYRDRYYDTPDAWYRYSDGYIYRVDPTTRLITAVIDALV